MPRKPTRVLSCSRREFIRLSAVAGAGAVAVACGSAGEPAAEPSMAEGKYQEAPVLRDLVASGELPPVDERLPATPGVLPNADGAPGSYGGVMRRGFKGVSDRWGPSCRTGVWAGTTRT